MSNSARMHANLSIRSPHRSEGRYMPFCFEKSAILWFQSAPPTGVRGDWRRSIDAPIYQSFNPLPPPK